MKEFTKYPKMVNRSNEKKIFEEIHLHPSLQNAKYIAQEKIHGSNIQINIFHDKISVGSRNRILTPEMKHYSFLEVAQQRKYEIIYERIRNYIKSNGFEKATLWGEYCGEGVCKGIDYGKEHRILFFDISLDYKMQTPDVFYRLAEELGFEEVVIPVKFECRGIKAALEFDENFNSAFSIGESLSEGLVIKAFEGWIFRFKKKSEKFREISRVKKRPKKKIIRENIYIPFVGKIALENRVESYYSKNGRISEKSQMGLYINNILKDINEDLDVEPLKTERGYPSKAIAAILLEELCIKN